ncbi:MAG: response regulator [Clostridia bacterium]|nr:response regulator [Clostridia bacterium]
MLGTIHILCAVRDRQSLRSLIVDMDDGETCIFDTVTTGRQALEQCRKVPPDILIIDSVLPEMDGLSVVDCLRDELGERMPRVIGGSRTAFSRRGFIRRGIGTVVPVPWDVPLLKSVILHERRSRECDMDWQALDSVSKRAGLLLTQMGMPASLKGYAYLSHAAALACENEARLFSVGSGIYEPVAARFCTTKENVERLIRHAIESTMNAARARGVYTLFGNTIDPAKGKPTNAQAIALLVQRLRVENAQQRCV